mmetsp:Transcript_15390/g.32560  ORF Transcript_15390/g.32560 Transcript_15390/m.32560 type:complete len:279 (+) Transcript_15390:226-1062(+)
MPSLLHRRSSMDGAKVSCVTSPTTRRFLEVRELSLKRNHGITLVWDSNTVQSRDRSRDLVSAQESKDGKLSKTAVVEFGLKATLFGLFRHILVEAKGIIQVQNEVHIIPEQGERGVFSGLTSLGVVRHGSSATALIPKLQHGDDGKDLPLGSQGNSVPLRLWNEIRGRVGSSRKGLGPREDEVRLNNVSHEGEHGNSPVLDFGLTQPSDGGLVALAPEVLFGEVERIVVLDCGVESGGEGFEIGLTFGDGGGGASNLGGGECGRRGDEGGYDGGLHGH